MTQKCTSYNRNGMSQFACCYAWFIYFLSTGLGLRLQPSALSRYVSRCPWMSNAGTIPSCSLNVYDKKHNISYPVSSWYAAYLVTDNFRTSVSLVFEMFEFGRLFKFRNLITIKISLFWVPRFFVRSGRKLSHFHCVALFTSSCVQTDGRHVQTQPEIEWNFWVIFCDDVWVANLSVGRADSTKWR